MEITDILFYVFGGLLLLGAIGVVVAKNAIHCVLFLIFAFVNTSALFLLLGAEFLALLFLMVYVGAIAVMFLFVLMTIDTDFSKLKEGFAKYAPVALVLILILIAELFYASSSGVFSKTMAVATMPFNPEGDVLKQIGNVMFTNYAFPFLLSSLVLLVAMIGAIVLTHRKRNDVKKQNITEQISRKREDSVELVSPEKCKGIDIE